MVPLSIHTNDCTLVYRQTNNQVDTAPNVDGGVLEEVDELAVEEVKSALIVW
jgi:hypothetical protein